MFEDIKILKEVDKATPALAGPPPRGSLTVKAAGLGRCVVGTRYPNMTFFIPERTYRLRDVTVMACASSSPGRAAVIDTFSVNYASIDFGY